VFATVLVANRGEIAVRVIATLRRLGIRSVAVYSDADTHSPHVALADTAVRLGPAPAAQSYLAIDRVVDAAIRSGAQAIHPGYGFLSERAAFARAVADAGLVFVGPPAHAIETMGDKVRAKRLAARAGVPLVPGADEADGGDLVAAAQGLGYPLLVKAAAGGGGKGMRVVRGPAGLPDALSAARREALAAFGDGALLLERYVERPRHLEIQVLADDHGACVALGERECSLQRRYQKVVEEAPSPLLDPAAHERMSAGAVALAQAVGYTGVGTVEFLVSGDGAHPGLDGPGGGFAFLEMNTRLQVEHPVTEQVWGLDLVEQQLRVAAGEALPAALVGPSRSAGPSGHAVEARVYAEDPRRGFLPTGGRVLALRAPSGEPGVRLDLGIATGTAVGSAYDPLLGKVIAHGADRAEALRRLDAALGGLAVLGVTTNVAFLRRLLADPDVRAGRLDTGLIARMLEAGGEGDPGAPPAEAFVAAALADLLGAPLAPGVPVDPFAARSGWRVGGHATVQWRLAEGVAAPVEVEVTGTPAAATVRVDGGPQRAAALRAVQGGVILSLDGLRTRWALARDDAVIWLGREGAAWGLRVLPRLAAGRAAGAAAATGPLRAPLPGTVLLVAVAEGDTVVAGQTLVVVEAMKMEHPVAAPADGVVTRVAVRAGQQVPIDAELAVVEPREGGA